MNSPLPNKVKSPQESHTREEILDTAKQYVMKDRNATHGDPENNFRTIAEYWSTYLQSRGFHGSLSPEDVAAMMILMKTSRLSKSSENADHWIDIAGYAACGGEVATAEPSF